MRLSCLPVSFFPQILSGELSVAEWARMGVNLGLDAIDLSILFVKDRTPDGLANLRRQIESEGTRVAMVTSYPDFTHPDPDWRRQEIVKGVETVETAARLGAEMVRITAGQAYPGVQVADGIAWAVEGIQALSAATAGMGVTLVYENHARPMVWDYTDFSQPPEIFLEIVRRTQAINLQVNFDTGNAASFAEDPLALLEDVLPRIYSIHASDTARRGALEHVLLGTGVTPYPAIFHRLRTFGWDGWICMEEASKSGVGGIQAAANYIRTTWSAAASV